MRNEALSPNSPKPPPHHLLVVKSFQTNSHTLRAYSWSMLRSSAETLPWPQTRSDPFLCNFTFFLSDWLFSPFNLSFAGLTCSNAATSFSRSPLRSFTHRNTINTPKSAFCSATNLAQCYFPLPSPNTLSDKMGFHTIHNQSTAFFLNNRRTPSGFEMKMIFFYIKVLKLMLNWQKQLEKNKTSLSGRVDSQGRVYKNAQFTVFHKRSRGPCALSFPSQLSCACFLFTFCHKKSFTLSFF